MAKRRWSPFNSTEPIRPPKGGESSTGSSFTFPSAKHSRKWWVRLLAGVAVGVLLLIGAAHLLTHSDWGRERSHRYVVGIMQNNRHRIGRIGSVSGNLLHGITLHDVVITDSAHAPFIKAD